MLERERLRVPTKQTTEYHRKWMAAHPGYKRQWELDNPAKLKATRQRYYVKHKDALNAKSKAYREENRDKVLAKARETSKAYYAKNRELCKAKYREYYAKNKQAIKIRSVKNKNAREGKSLVPDVQIIPEAN